MTTTQIQNVTPDNIDIDISITQPQFPVTRLHEIASKWVKRQGRHWPPEITPEQLVEQLSVYYLPYWVVSGRGSGQWSASIGVDHTKIAICSTCSGKGRAATVFNLMEDNAECTTCNGSGRVEKTETIWSSQAGFVEASVTNRVLENFDVERANLKCGKRKFDVESTWLPEDEVTECKLIPTLQTDAEAGKQRAIETILTEAKDEAQRITSDMGYVRNLQTINLQTHDVNFYMWLYPLYLGHYLFEDELWTLQIDGVTGKMWGEVPKSVKSKQWQDRIVALLIVVGIAAIVYGIWWLGLSLNWW